MIFAMLAAAVAALLDWLAVVTDRQRLESVAKPAVMVSLILAALIADGASATVRALIVGGLALGLFGDVLLLPRVDRFIWGLGAFLIGHALYVAAFVSYDVQIWPAMSGLLAVAALFALVGPAILAAVADSRLAIPVTLYITTIGAMVVTAWGTGNWWFAGGALVFAASDAVLGYDRFVTPRTDRRLWVHVLYHAGQAALVAGLWT